MDSTDHLPLLQIGKTLQSKLKDLGVQRHEFDWGESKFEIQSLTPADEVFIYERAADRSSTQAGRLVFTQLYTTSLMVRKIGELNVHELVFGETKDLLNDTERARICVVMEQVFLHHIDRKVFRYLFKYCWSWSEARAVEFARDKGIESFMTPDELEVYGRMQEAEAIEQVVSEERTEVADFNLLDDNEE